MARPQGIHSPLMVPYGPSIKQVTIGNSVTGFNVDTNFKVIADLQNQAGYYLGLCIRSVNGTLGAATTKLTFEGITPDVVSHGLGNRRAGRINAVNSGHAIFEPGFNFFASSLKAEISDAFFLSPADPDWATIWYCDRVVPSIPGVSKVVSTSNFATVNDTYAIILQVSNSGGQINHLQFNNLNTKGLLQSTLKITIDGQTPQEYAFSDVAFPSNIDDTQTAGIFPSSFRWNNSITIEGKVSNATGTQAAECLYTLDA